MTTTFIDVEGHRTRVSLAGDPSDPPVLLLHGIGRSLEDWSPQVPRLSRAHRLISFDLPGSGFSQRRSGRTDLPLLASAALATLEAIGETRPVHFIGNSLGGAVAQQVSVLDPDRVASLVLVNSAGFGSEVALPLRLLTLPGLGRIMATHTTRSSARLSESLGYASPSWVTQARIEHALAIAREPDTGDVLWETACALATARGGVRPEWREVLISRVARQRKPTLLIWGDQDRVLPHQHLEEAVRRYPHAQAHLFAGVGHMPQIETAEAFASLVLEFLKQNTSSRRANKRGPGRSTDTKEHR